MLQVPMKTDCPHQFSPSELIPYLCRSFYEKGWCSGTGGGIGILAGSKVFIAPSSVQKELIEPNDIYELEYPSLKVLYEPQGCKPSQCLPLFNAAFRNGANVCIHSHSINVNLASQLFSKEFRITGQEMIKGIIDWETKKTLNLNDVLVIPIIENTPFECELESHLKKSMVEYPKTCAVIVKCHGIYVWAETWEKAKGMAECIDYLCDLSVRMHWLNLK
eukprot:NODE_199_length_15263_cov_0.256331.p5 type:complete len:219 gc:universal NODE_199_length_15263_cov_0.256331:14153-14809(+)